MASVSVGLESKERPKNAAFSVLPGRKIVRERRKKKTPRKRLLHRLPGGRLPGLSFIYSHREGNGDV